MLKSLIAGLLALLAATFGLHHSTVATAPTTQSPYADTGLVQHHLAQVAAAAAAPPLATTTPSFQELSSGGQTSPQPAQPQSSHIVPATQSSLALDPLGDYITPGDLSAQINDVQAWVREYVAQATSTNTTALIPQQVAADGNYAAPFAAAQAINQLSNVTVSGITGLTAAEIPDLSGTYLPLSGGTVTGNLTVAGSFSGGSLSLSSASSTDASSTYLFATNAVFTNATSTNFFSTLGDFTSAVVGTLNASIANIVGLTATNATTTNLVATNATTTNLAVTGTSYLAGNVGIGTTTPGSIFSIAGVANWTNATSTYYSTGGINLAAGCFAIAGNCLSSPWTASGSNLSYAGGNVGIGTTSPSANLSIQATAGQPGNLLTIASSSNAYPPYFNVNANGLTSLVGRAPTPTLVAEIKGPVPGTTLSGGDGIFVTGKYAYVTAANQHALSIIDISNPTSPNYITQLTGLGNTIQPFVVGKYAYLAAGGSGLQIADISNPSSPSLISTTGNMGTSNGIFVSGKYAYLTTNKNALYVVDISNPASPFIIASTTGPVAGTSLKSPNQVFVQGKFAYVTDDTATGGLAIVEISDPANPTFIASTTIADATGLFVRGRYAYVDGNNVFDVVDISNPASPSLVASVSGPPTLAGAVANNVFVSGNYAYVSDFNPDGSLAVFNISNPTSPVFLTYMRAEANNVTNCYGGGTFVQGRYVYTMCYTNASFDVTDIGGADITNLTAGSIAAENLDVSSFGQFENGLGISDGLNVGGDAWVNGGFTVNGGASTTAKLPTAMSVLGNVGIGTSSAYSRLEVWGPDTASTSAFTVINNASTTEFSVYDNGNATYNGSIFQSSDERLKTDIVPLDGSSSLSAILTLNPISYTRVDQPGGGENLGFLAQAVEAIFPELVSTTSPTALTPDGTLTLNYEGLIAPIVSAVQEIASISGNFEQNLIAWLGSASNGIADLFANNLHAQNEICISSTCIDQQQLAAILASQSGASSGQGSGSSSVSATSTPDTPPVIQINGDNPASIDVGATYQDLGATITGPQQDLNLGIEASVDGGATTTPDQITVDTSQPGTHAILYCATDQSGLSSCATRTINVLAAARDGNATTTSATSTPS